MMVVEQAFSGTPAGGTFVVDIVAPPLHTDSIHTAGLRWISGTAGPTVYIAADSDNTYSAGRSVFNDTLGDKFHDLYFKDVLPLYHCCGASGPAMFDMEGSSPFNITESYGVVRFFPNPGNDEERFFVAIDSRMLEGLHSEYFYIFEQLVRICVYSGAVKVSSLVDSTSLIFMEVLHFIKYFRDGFAAYLTKVGSNDAIIVFDLEDSIRDVHNAERTVALKQKYRGILKYVIREFRDQLGEKRVGIRLNGVRTKEITKDLELLKELSAFHWDVIIIPMVDGPDDVRAVKQALDERSIAYGSLVVLIETRAGMDNLPRLVEHTGKFISHVIFGHADFNMDNEYFPFYHQDCAEYWEWVHEIQQALLGTDIVFINSPLLFLGNTVLMQETLDRLHAKSIVPYGQMTLTAEQTRQCNRFQPAPPKALQPARKVEPLAYARYVLDMLGCKDEDKSFTIDGSRHLLTPHEIELATRMVEDSERK